MEKIISARHSTLEDAMKDHILAHLARIETEYTKLTSARVVLDSQRNWHFAEVLIHGKNIEIEGKAKEGNERSAVDSAIDKAERQLIKFVDKLKSHHNHNNKRERLNGV